MNFKALELHMGSIDRAPYRIDDKAPQTRTCLADSKDQERALGSAQERAWISMCDHALMGLAPAAAVSIAHGRCHDHDELERLHGCCELELCVTCVLVCM